MAGSLRKWLCLAAVLVAVTIPPPALAQSFFFEEEEWVEEDWGWSSGGWWEPVSYVLDWAPPLIYIGGCRFDD